MADQVRKFDGRILTLKQAPSAFNLGEKVFRWIPLPNGKSTMLPSTTQPPTVNPSEPAAFWLSASTKSLRNQFAARTLQRGGQQRARELMESIAKGLNSLPEATSLGVTVVDVRVKRIDLPNEVSEPVYSRMRTEREREAKEHRSVGEAEAVVIRAEADRKRTELLADAYRQSEFIRGEADAKAAEIYAGAF